MPEQVRLNPEDQIPDAANATKLLSDSVVGKLFAGEFVARGDPFRSSNTALVQNPSEKILRS